MSVAHITCEYMFVLRGLLHAACTASDNSHGVGLETGLLSNCVYVYRRTLAQENVNSTHKLKVFKNFL